jgi:SAM-dependent MidA family methyltransferase
MVAAGGLAFDRDGEIVERAPQREDAVAQLAGRLARHGGAALLIDYGHERSASGDTLQAVRGHGYAPVLSDPGEQDLTAHVDFGAVSHAAAANGASVSAVVTQRDWLNRLGIGARAATLANANPKRETELAGAVQRLTARDQMGGLFKVLAIRSPEWPEVAGFA